MTEYSVQDLRATCSFAPAAWEGVLEDGTEIYFRYRWAELTVRLNDEVNGEIIFQEQLHDDDSRSNLSESELRELTPDKIRFFH